MLPFYSVFGSCARVDVDVYLWWRGAGVFLGVGGIVGRVFEKVSLVWDLLVPFGFCVATPIVGWSFLRVGLVPFLLACSFVRLFPVGFDIGASSAVVVVPASRRAFVVGRVFYSFCS